MSVLEKKSGLIFSLQERDFTLHGEIHSKSFREYLLKYTYVSTPFFKMNFECHFEIN